MAATFPPLWPGTKIPAPYNEMSCQEMIREYRSTKFSLLVVWLIKLVDGPKRRLTVILYNILGDYSLVEDFFQNLFIFLQQELLKVNNILNCGAWFSRVVKNRALNELKRAKKRPEVEGSSTLAKQSVQHEETKRIQQVDARKVVRKMEEKLLGIELGWTCVYTRWTGKSYTEAAGELGLTFTQFRGRYQRAHTILSREFGRDYEKYLDWAHSN